MCQWNTGAAVLLFTTMDRSARQFETDRPLQHTGQCIPPCQIPVCKQD